MIKRLALLAVAMLLFAGPVGAAPQSEQDSAREALIGGKVIPYGAIKQRAERMFGGRIVGQRMRQFSRDRWVYELRILRQSGEVLTVTMDARSGQVIGRRGGRR